MRLFASQIVSRLLLAGCFSLLVAPSLHSERDDATIQGTVTDPRGALVASAVVTATLRDGEGRKARTDGHGEYLLQNMMPGSYRLVVEESGFSPWRRDDIEVREGQKLILNVSLELGIQQQSITVSDHANGPSVRPDGNASALLFERSDLDALPYDSSELQTELGALAGIVPGSDPGQVYVDGFSGAALPGKSAIRAIAINQNPFSARYDRVGFGRIEVMTKAGTDRFHGDMTTMGNDSAFNSRNPFASDEPPYHLLLLNADFSGPVTRDSAFFLNTQRGKLENNAIISAIILNSSLAPMSLNEAVPNPSVALGGSGRFDTQLGPHNTLTMRFQINQGRVTNSGVGQFALPSQGYDATSATTTSQVSDTHVLNAKLINQLQFQYMHETTNQLVGSKAPKTIVEGAFISGGNSSGNGLQASNHFEAQENISLDLEKQSIQVGGRLRALTKTVQSEPNFNGQFVFSSLNAYQVTLKGLQQGWSAAQIRVAGGGPVQFELGAGSARTSIAMSDVGAYWQDDRRLRQNLTWSYGLRFESQDNIHDHADLAPRFGLAWSPNTAQGGTPRTAVRVGYGWFYTRFAPSYVLQAKQQNGTNQKQYVVSLPDFYPSVPSAAAVGEASPSTIYRIDPALRVPLLMQASVSVDRQFGRSTTLSITYANSRGVHQLLSRNLNAPLPGTYDPGNPESGARPLGKSVSMFEYQAGGVFRQNQLIVNFRTRAASRLNLFGYYCLNDAKANTAGASSFPSNEYDLAADYGRAAYDIHQRFLAGGLITLPFGFQASPLVTASSGAPFNIIVGEDLNGDGQFNDRPAFATDLSRPSVAKTSLGNFDTDPIPGQKIIPINLGNGPPQFSTNLRLSKTFSFGPEHPGTTSPHAIMPGKGRNTDRRFSLSFDASARNVFNYVNLAQPVGTLGSPLFGRSNASSGGQSANRVINLQARISF